MDYTNYGLQTLLSHYAEENEKYLGAAAVPIFETSTFVFESYEEIDDAFSRKNKRYIYTRGMNPTVEILEKKLAALEKGERAKCFASGMAAISSAILSVIKAGDHVICVKNIYGPTYNFLSKYLTKFNIETTFVNGENFEEIKEAIRENTSLIYLESPNSLIFMLQDIKKIASFAKERGIKTIIDNSWASPVFQNPLEMGIDVVVHSASKYIGGHSDVVAGCIIGNKDIISRIEENEYPLLGGILAPFEAWLLIRGLRTLEIRMEKHMKNALAISEFLAKHPKISKIYYPGHPSHPQYELARKQMKGFSGLLSIEIDCDIEGVKRFINNLKIIKLGVSWGGYESLAFPPVISYSKEIPAERFKDYGIKSGLVRLSVGLENVEDLIDDLERALLKV